MNIKDVHPYLNFRGEASQAIELYTSVFGGEVTAVMRWRDMPGQDFPEAMADHVMHSCITIGGRTVSLSDVPPHIPLASGQENNIMVEFGDPDDLDRAFAALSEGGTVQMPVENTFWGARFGKLTDRFGIRWMFNCQLG